MTTEEIAHLVGRVTARGYRKQECPAITRGAGAINELLEVAGA